MHSLLNLSEATNIAIHALAYLAVASPEEPQSAAHLAAAIGVSESHLAKVLQKLARDGFITSVRGAKGGFGFAKPPCDITFYDVVTAMQDLPDPDACLLGRPICAGGRCVLKGLKHRVTDLVKEELSAISLCAFSPENLPAALADASGVPAETSSKGA